MEYKDLNCPNCPHKEEWTLVELPSLFADESRQMDHNIDNPIPVPSNILYHRFWYTQLYRGVRSCLYQQTLYGKTVGYEVFLICIQPEININGEIYLEHEHWRRDADFGKTAWSCWTLEQAKERFNLLES